MVPWLPESFERNEISESKKRVINIVSTVQNRRTVRIVDRELDDDIRHFNLCAARKVDRHRPSDGDPVDDSRDGRIHSSLKATVESQDLSQSLNKILPGLGNLTSKNMLIDRFFGSKYRQVTGQGFSGPSFRQES